MVSRISFSQESVEPTYNLTVFDQDGHFIRESQAMNASSVSYPFEPSDTLPDNVNPTLRSLMDKLKESKESKESSFLEGLFNTLCAAGETVKHPPNSYAETMMSILRKPLAVVQMGFSLELANAPLANHSTIAYLRLEDITSYNISMKLGDKTNRLVGLVGYFMQKKDDPSSYDMNSLFSYFAPSQARGPSVSIAEFFSLEPYYLNPADYNQNEISYAQAHDNKRQVIAAIADPFVSVHANTEMLPIKLLSLPPWTISSGIKRVSTFYRMGPLLIPGDPVPDFVEAKKVNHDNQLDEKNIPDTTGSIPVPVALNKDGWVCLQPFWQEGNSKDGGETEYNFLDIDGEGGQIPL
ncbi:hypothetical protein TSTA_079120 [Talaromyces stipitatus ATCC 10500]|uniref:Uncharacterized protein n=1 Tax=Talaromyces stipitatus (strain ATCC 10500 / CBS 375.48 / QM 6759 / NRRL 1006) TaxID=441959 RepID=B8LXQ5_TALSN|nr:uncharacterized protein TSTA_079120 [Talaromyces stipitatus ATCC 10500]EED24556.1 hypothetical protein TSTA_079120 [Talaromyces stipitatus ATCC 10500]